MNRIDDLENQMNAVNKETKRITEDEEPEAAIKYSKAQNLKDKEIIEYLGDEHT